MSRPLPGARVAHAAARLASLCATVTVLAPGAVAAQGRAPAPDSVAVAVAVAAGPRAADPVGAHLASADTTRRPRAITYSDAYEKRLTVHRIGSYAMLPLFAAEYLLGDRLLSEGEKGPAAGWVQPTHVGVAVGLGALFTVNTATGLWNLYDSRHDPADRTRKWLHTALMIASDAGFAYTGAIAGDAQHSLSGRDRHRNAALTSMGIATAGTALMWLWRN